MESIWTDPEINKTVSLMDPKTRYAYSKVGAALFNTVDPESFIFESAAQIKLMLRDGLDPSSLSDEEKRILVSAYGPDEMETEYGINISFPNENEQKASGIIFSDPGENQGTTQSNGGAEGDKKTNNGRSDRLSKPIRRTGNPHRRKYCNYACTKRQENKQDIKSIQKVSK